jgi:hypothetical protein
MSYDRLMYGTLSLNEALELAVISEVLDGVVSMDELWMIGMLDDIRGEQLAESAWLRHAESRGWEDAHRESLMIACY